MRSTVRPVGVIDEDEVADMNGGGLLRRRPARRNSISTVLFPIPTANPPSSRSLERAGTIIEDDPSSTTACRSTARHPRDSFEIRQSALWNMQTDGTLESLSHERNARNEAEYLETCGPWRRWAEQVSPSDTPTKELIRRTIFLIMSTMTVGAGVLWSLMYVYLDEYLAAVMPKVYSSCMSLVLGLCTTSTFRSDDGWGGYKFFVNAQLLLILLLPFAVHIALGGVEKSGGVMLWSFLCPVGAAFFRNTKEGLKWFKLYMFITVVLLTKEFWDVNDYVISGDGGSDNIIDGTYSEGENSSVVSTVNDVFSYSSKASSSGTIRKLYWWMNIACVKCVIFAAVYFFARELETEYAKSERMLLNILPSSIVKRIKRGEFPIVDHVADVTILFADLVGFTKASTEHHPNFLIGLFLRDIFEAFDNLAYKHGLEKIKTIGDAYMVVGGLVHGEKLSTHSHSQSAEYANQKSHATNIMMFAVDCFKALRTVNMKYSLEFELRVGIHNGPVVAGVLGLKRLAYDVWGDTVNTASRMESNGVPGHIHITSEMHDVVCGMTKVFDFTCRGKTIIKGKGELTTYLARILNDDGTPLKSYKSSGNLQNLMMTSI